MEGFRLPPIMFTEDEANALLTADLIIQSSKDTSLIVKFSEALSKVRAAMSTRILKKTELLQQKMGVSNVYIDGSPKSKYLLEIQKALVAHLVVSVDYTSKEGKSSQRKLEPFAVFSNQNNEWVLVAFCRLRNDFRTFSLINIDTFIITSETFEPHKMTFPQYLEKTYGNKTDK
ncbi:MAG TPA: WYL domain-containing protein [Saprospiraceae bacterium]|nr:WYL domain-containing protein [Saprospiraceae bacterium]HPN68724.1 WYL domain-containing protein [Saprospiraceae bacterium]